MAGQSNYVPPATFSPAEVEFLAENVMINIIPSLRMDTLHLICGDFGPFRPQMPIQVPLWLAIAMKKRGKCRIQVPDWMTADKLNEVLREEREQPKDFQPVPFHYIEISRLLFDHAHDDIPELYQVKMLMEDIRNVRFHKMEVGLQNLMGKTYAVKLTNLSAMELNIIRAFTVRALESFFNHGDEEYISQANVRFTQPTPRSRPLGGRR